MVELAIGIAHVSILLGECIAAPPEIHGGGVLARMIQSTKRHTEWNKYR